MQLSRRMPDTILTPVGMIWVVELQKRYKLPVVSEEQTGDNLRSNVSAPTQELDLGSWESFGSDL